jgi:hypothetical protein
VCHTELGVACEKKHLESREQATSEPGLEETCIYVLELNSTSIRPATMKATAAHAPNNVFGIDFLVHSL